MDLASLRRQISWWHIWSSISLQVGSPTGLADAALEKTLRDIAASGSHGLYIPSGALWGATDIEKMDQLGTLKVNSLTR
jgi:hypothetical protein